MTDSSSRVPVTVQPLQMVAVINGAELKFKDDIASKHLVEPELRFSGWRYPTSRCWAKYYWSLVLWVLTFGWQPRRPRPERYWFESPVDKLQPWRHSRREYKLRFEASAAAVLMSLQGSYKPFDVQIVAIDHLHQRHPVTTLPNLLILSMDASRRLDNPEAGQCEVTFTQMM